MTRMYDGMFNDMDPWERLVNLDQRVQQLENINNELVRHIQITSRHCDDMSKAIIKLQREQLEQLHMLNTSGDHND